MITVNKYTKKEYFIPENFNELTLKQLLKIIPLIEAGGDRAALEVKCLQIILNVSKFRYFFISAEVKLGLFPLIGWLFEENNLTEQKLPHYKGLYGPKKEFDNIILKEFHHSETYYDEFLQDDAGSEKALNHLIAVLYRKPKTFYNKKQDIDGDIRKPFNENLVSYFAEQVSKWPRPVKLVILAYYHGSRQHIRQLYDPVFSGGKDTVEKGDPGMFDCIREIARDGKYGPFDKVEVMNIHTALHEMDKSIEEAEEIKRLYQTNTSV